MSTALPRTVHRELAFAHGSAIGISNRWEKGQYCAILTKAGIVGCGIYDLKTPAEFGQAIAIAKGTPACPLTEPEDLFEARIVGLTSRAAATTPLRELQVPILSGPKPRPDGYLQTFVTDPDGHVIELCSPPSA